MASILVELKYSTVNDKFLIDLLRPGAKLTLTHDGVAFRLRFEGNEAQIDQLRLAMNADMGVELSPNFDDFIDVWGVRGSILETPDTPVGWMWTDGGGYNAHPRFSSVNPSEDYMEVVAQGASSVGSCTPVFLTGANRVGYRYTFPGSVEFEYTDSLQYAPTRRTNVQELFTR